MEREKAEKRQARERAKQHLAEEIVKLRLKLDAMNAEECGAAALNFTALLGAVGLGALIAEVLR